MNWSLFTAGAALALGMALSLVPGGDALAEPASLAATAILPHDLSPWGMFLAAAPVVKTVMVGLGLASVATWTVGLAKAVELAAERRRIARSLSALAESRTLVDAAAHPGCQQAPVAPLLHAAMTETRLSGNCPGEGLKERVASRLERIEAAYGRRLAQGSGILATIGATAPFVGLFGTVWGIMNSFVGISKTQTTNLAVVAPGIAEALLATAMGLVAAIPAVVIYNAFARSIAARKATLGDASAEVLRLVSRDVDCRTLPFGKAAE